MFKVMLLYLPVTTTFVVVDVVVVAVVKFILAGSALSVLPQGSLTHESAAKILSCVTFPPLARFKNT